MALQTEPFVRRLTATGFTSIALLMFAACGEGSTGPQVDPPGDTITVLPATGFDRSDLTAGGTVVETEDGFLVDGTLTLATSDTTSVTFADADMRVRFDDDGRLTSMSGTSLVPPPDAHVGFEDPVRAEVGVFSGKFLNEQRDLPILLQDDRDYFVFDVALTLQMNIATGATGPSTIKSVTLTAPLGGRILMVIDYADPMYYTYGEQDLLGALGIGWSEHGRIPFVPARQVAGLGAFDGQNTRTGTIPIFKIISVTGQTVDNEYTELHLLEQDPYVVGLRQGYQQGWNGAFELDLGIKDVFGLTIPVGDGAGGVWAEASMQDVFEGHAYAVGATTDDFSWWPPFLPISPASGLEVSAYVTHEGEFEVALAGQYGWVTPSGLQTMGGGFELNNDAMTLTGEIVDAGVTWAITGRITADSTTVVVVPPQQLLDSIAGDVRDDVMPRIDAAQQAWENLKEATADYEFELSLRGIRTQLPGIVDATKSALSSAIANELASHEGTLYYNSLRSHLLAADDAYYSALDNLKAQALQATDNDQTRLAIEAALRSVAAKKIFTTTYRYYDPIFGTLLYTVNVSRRIMSDTQANTLIEAADNVQYIEDTSNVMISMQQIYDQVDDKALFEQVRDDIQNGLLVMRTIGELGFVYPHAAGQGAYNVFAVIDGQRYEAGAISGITLKEFVEEVWPLMVQALTVN